MDAKVWHGIHVGYAPGNAYRAYIPELELVFVSKDVTFIEKLYGEPTKIAFEMGSSSNQDGENEHEDDHVNNDENDNSTDDLEPYRAPWICGEHDAEQSVVNVNGNDNGTTNNVRSKKRGKSSQRRNAMTNLAFVTTEALNDNVSDMEPKTKDEAMKMANKTKWAVSMMDEIISLLENNVFNIVKMPRERKKVASRGVYALKRNSRGLLHRHKARLVARGYSQIHGIDYDEVYEPVVKFATLRFLLTHVAMNDMKLKQVDVKTGFLHVLLFKDIYMDIPEITDEFMKIYVHT